MSDVTPRPGTGGTVIDPTAQENELLMKGPTSTDIIGSGAIFSVIDDKYVFPKSIQTPASSIDLGTNINIHENGGFIETTTQTADSNFILLEFENDPDTGSVKPIYFERGVKEDNVVIQSDDSTQMFNVTSFNIGFPTFERQDQAITFNFINPVTNFAIRILVSGRPVAFYPTEQAWLGNELGENFGIGIQKMQWDPFFSNLVNYDITVEMKADQNIDLLGDGIIPYIELDLNRITRRDIALDDTLPLESISTALINGGEITASTTTSIDIAAGTGRIVTFDAQGNPTIQQVSWNPILNYPITNIATQSGTRIAIDSNGDVVELTVIATPQTNRDYVNIGVVAHAAGIIGRITNTGFKAQEVYDQLIDNLQTLGVTRRAGLIINGNADLSFSKTAGAIEAPGAGVDNLERGQNIVSIAAENPSTFTTVLGITDTPVAAGQTLIEPGFYDNGTGSPVAITAPLSQATIQYVYQSILQPGGLYVMYGQTVYNTLDDAILNAPNDNVALPDLILGSSNLIARIAVRADATDLSDLAQAEVLSGVKFGTGSEGGSFGSGGGGGGDFFGPASSIQNSILTFADTTGKVGKSDSDVVVQNGVMQRSTPNASLRIAPNGIGDVNTGNAHFIDGDDLNYPSTDGQPSDSMVTDGSGNLQFLTDTYDLITTNTTLGYGDKRVYIDASGGDITVTLGDNPRDGEKKTLWIGNKDNIITLDSANPAFPINPPPQIGEGNIQGQWTLTSDFLDRYTTGRDLTQQGTGGAFVPDVVNGNNVNVYDFEGTSYLEAVDSSYKGILGSTRRSFTCWYASNSGQPTGNETIVSWGDNQPGGGRWWTIEFDAATQQLQVDIKNARRGFTYANLNAVNLFDGNIHHLAVIQSSNFVNPTRLYVDGVEVPQGPVDNSPGMNTISNFNFKLGAFLTGGNILNGKLYDARLFDRALSLNELNEIINENILGGVTISAADKDMVFDVTYNGSEWVLGVGTEALALTNEAEIVGLDARVTALEDGIVDKVEFEMQRLSSYSIPVGFDQTINYNTVFKYLINDDPQTPNISGGIWTVDIGGLYLISVEGWLDRLDIGYDTDYVLLTVSRNGQNFTTANPAATANLLISVARHFGSLNLSTPIALNAGDTIELKTRNIGSTTQWDLNNFIWKATLIND